ncbi:hypothetical protein [Paenacidovorax monticola]|uniref:Uncharacterized protein n=1 Tax=Paenacidovorax monticola TaxID=1926868 RepID=A0A7H0HJ77_9BURK|nr:hypothetical protein [Paenacidovorax monticola]QNP60593.1 hypothetical protein H9L24_07180 [Paenacidovorax monticola]
MSVAFALHHPGGLHIAPGLQESTLLDTYPALIVQPREPRVAPPGSGWTWWRLAPWSVGGFAVGIELAFLHGTLRECLLFHDDDSRYGRDWSEWSERKERQRAKALRTWLAAHGWRPDSYPWGEIWVGHDPRTGMGGGWVRYGGVSTMRP